MLTLVVKLEPAQEVTYTYTSALGLSIIPVYNFELTGAIPCSLTPGVSEAYLSSSELSWYTQRISIWAKVDENRQSVFDLELHQSNLIAAGLQIRVSTITNEVLPEIFTFPPGTLSIHGFRAHIDLGRFMQRIRNARDRSPQLFQRQYSQFLDARSQLLLRYNNQPLPPNQRATSDFISRPHSIRQTEQHINEQRERQLRSSSLF